MASISVRQSDGNHLSQGSAVPYLSNLLNQARDQVRASNDGTTRLFFTCLEDKCSTDSAVWLHALKKEMNSVIFERAKAAGSKMDFSQLPIYKHHIEKMTLTLGGAQKK